MSSPVVIMDRGNNTTCIINLHGSTIVSWRVNNQEQLFVSKKSVFDGRQPIRGGIPFIFPQVLNESLIMEHLWSELIERNNEANIKLNVFYVF